MTTERSIVSEQLNEEYKKKGIHSILDKRRILRDVLGKEPTCSAIQLHDMVTVIQYLKGKTREELQSNVIAWAYVVHSNGELLKKQIRILLDNIPSNVQVFPFSLHEEDVLETGSMAIGFIHNHYFVHYEKEIKEVLTSVCKDVHKKREDALYTLSNGLQMRIFYDRQTAFCR